MVFDLKRNKMLIDAHWFSYLGIPAGDCEITIEKFFSRVHPNERDMLADALQKQLSEKEIPDSFSYRLQRAMEVGSGFLNSRCISAKPMTVHLIVL